MLTLAHFDAPVGDVLRYSVIDGGLFVRADVTWDGQTAPMWIAYEDVVVSAPAPKPVVVDITRTSAPSRRPGEPVPFGEHDPEGRWAS